MSPEDGWGFLYFFFWLFLPLFFVLVFPRDFSAHNTAEKSLVAYSQTQAHTQNQYRFFSQSANNSVIPFWPSERKAMVSFG